MVPMQDFSENLRYKNKLILKAIEIFEKLK